MPRYLPPPAPLALALSLMFGGSAIWAQSPANLAPAAAPLDISIPAQALGDALNAWARQTGLQIAVQQSLVVGKSAPAVSGSLSPRQALDRLLAGSGLIGVADGLAMVVKVAPQTATSEAVLPVVTVRAGVEALPGELPKPYAGGQVARGGQVGLLGNRDVMDTPFSVSSYTSQRMEEQQAKTIRDVVVNDASVRMTSSIGSYYDSFTVRGLNVSIDDTAFHGMYGIASVFSNSVEFAERVEILKGPGAMLYGIAPSGGVGGVINLVPKRAADEPLTKFTLDTQSGGRSGAHLDAGRRFGQDNQWGIRFNGAYRKGETAIDQQRIESQLGALALDYRGERLRASLDVVAQENDVRSPQYNLWVPAGIAIPRAPDLSANYEQRWAVDNAKTLSALVRAEFDITDNLTAHAAYGGKRLDRNNTLVYSTLLNSQGDTSSDLYVGPFSSDTDSTELGLKGKFKTGTVKHELALAANHLNYVVGYDSRGGPSFMSNIYSPVLIADPGVDNGGYPTPAYGFEHTSLALADTMSFIDDRLQVTLGVRQQRIQNYNMDAMTGARQPDTYDQKAVSPSAAVVFKLTPEWSVYGNYIQGLSAGPTAPLGTVNAGAIFAPIRSKQRELGFKWDRGSLLATASLFDISLPSSGTDPNTNVFGLIGEQRNRGLELSATGEPIRGFRLLTGATLLDAKLSKTPTGLNQGKRAPATSEAYFNAGVEWDTPGIKGLTWSAMALHTSKAFIDAANLQSVPAWTRFDLGVRYATVVGGRAVKLNARLINAAGRDHWVAASGALTKGEPRTVMLSASMEF
jgi:iron complex outermembrane receptor protein